MRRLRQDRPIPDLTPLPSPELARTKIASLKERRGLYQRQIKELNSQIEELDKELELAPKVHKALESLFAQMFDELLEAIGGEMSQALQEVMQQEVLVRSEVDISGREGMRVKFWVERQGAREDLLRGQGGSVVNVLSVGMRMFALNEMDPTEHRPTLFLDEPDAWLSPDLVPRLLKVITQAATNLGFQVIVISHHDLGLLREGVNKIIEFQPVDEGEVRARVLFDDGKGFEAASQDANKGG